MAQEPTRSVFRMFLRNFLNSIRPRRIYSGELRGKDRFGNEYYEVPKDSSSARRLPRRWFKPEEKFNFEAEMPAEWEAWLRYRRKTPPTEQELEHNYQIMMMTKDNARKLAEKREAEKALEGGDRLPVQMSPQDEESKKREYPKYGDLELFPGQEMEKERLKPKKPS